MEKGIQIIWRMCAVFVLLFIVTACGVYVALKTDIITFGRNTGSLVSTEWTE